MKAKKKTSGIGRNLRDIRHRYGLSLTEVAARTGISRSTLYKVESAGVSLTYDKILQISDGLNIDITELFGRGPESPLAATPTRRSVGRLMEGYEVDTPNLTYLYLCRELLEKKLTPMVGHVKARDIKEYEQLTRHPGEEFDFVLEGEVDVHTEFYETVRLKKGEFIYLDSMMGHAFVSKSPENAVLLSVCSSPAADLTGIAVPGSVAAVSRTRKRGST
jgi:transcriptional regulator with XRE-family HTH domain